MVAADVAWATATYAMALSLLPQLLRLELSPAEAGIVPFAYLIPLCGAMLGSGSFWWMAFEELFVTDAQGNVLSRTPGKLVLSAQVVWAVLLSLCIGHNARRAIRNLGDG